MYVIKKRYGFLDGNIYTLDEIAKEMNYTREWIRKIEVRALRKLKTRNMKFKNDV